MLPTGERRLLARSHHAICAAYWYNAAHPKNIPYFSMP
jgi:hypothetical protein